MLKDKLDRFLLHRDIAARPGAYALPAAAAAVGAVCGLLAPGGLLGVEPEQVGPYLDDYLSRLNGDLLCPSREWLSFLKWNGGLLLALLLSGAYAAGPVFILVLLFLRAFTFAFADFYLACSTSSGAAALLSALLLPQALALLTGLKAGREALSFSRRWRTGGPGADQRWYGDYFCQFLLCLPTLALAAFLQARLVPLVLGLALETG